MPMKSQKIILIALLFLVVAGLQPSMGARLLENGLFFSPENPLAFHSKLNSVVKITGSGPFKGPKEKTRKFCGEPSTLAFTFKKNEMVGDKMKEEPNSEDVVLNVLAKGSVRPTGGSERGNNGIRSAQKLDKSNHSPGVGHMQIFNSPKSPQISGVTHTRILKSTPSPGGGH